MSVLATILIPRTLLGAVFRLGFLWIIGFIAYSAFAQVIVSTHPGLMLMGMNLIEHARLFGLDLTNPVADLLTATSGFVDELTRFLEQ